MKVAWFTPYARGGRSARFSRELLERVSALHKTRLWVPESVSRLEEALTPVVRFRRWPLQLTRLHDADLIVYVLGHEASSQSIFEIARSRPGVIFQLPGCCQPPPAGNLGVMTFADTERGHRSTTQFPHEGTTDAVEAFLMTAHAKGPYLSLADRIGRHVSSWPEESADRAATASAHVIGELMTSAENPAVVMQVR